MQEKNRPTDLPRVDFGASFRKVGYATIDLNERLGTLTADEAAEERRKLEESLRGAK